MLILQSVINIATKCLFIFRLLLVFTVLSAMLFISSCKSPARKTGNTESEAPAKAKPQTSWTLVNGSAISKPLSLFLKPVSDTIVLDLISWDEISRTFLTTYIEFDVIKKIDVKALRNELDSVRKDMPSRLSVMAADSKNSDVRQFLFDSYALLDITLLDSLKREIPNSTMTSYTAKEINNLTQGSNKVSFSFRIAALSHECGNIVAAQPRYFRVSLSDRAKGLSKVYSDYIKKTRS